jgi:hypothetical protein
VVLGWVRAELEARGHAVHTPDLPCEDVRAGVEEYAAAVPAADMVVGHSLGGLTNPYVEAHTHVFLTALVGGADRSYYPDPAVAASELQYPAEQAHLASRLRRQAPLQADPVAVERPVYVVCARDNAIRPEWQRRLARDVLGVEAPELDSGHSPMLERPRDLAALLAALV